MSTLIIKNVVTNKFESALDKQGINYTKISTRPSPLNTVLWNANIDTKNRYYVGDYSFFDKNDTIRFIPYPKKRAASTHLLKYEGIQRLIKISNGWYVLQKRKGHWYFNDFRFGLIPQEDGTEDFVFSYKIMEEGADISAFEVPKTNRDAKYLLETLWLRITGI
jgi:inner membrane protein